MQMIIPVSKEVQGAKLSKNDGQPTMLVEFDWMNFHPWWYLLDPR
jgi:hypothetical protein